MNTNERTDRDFELLFVGDKQRSMTHFFGIGVDSLTKQQKFAFGFYTPDGVFHQGIAAWDGETFTVIKSQWDMN